MSLKKLNKILRVICVIVGIIFAGILLYINLFLPRRINCQLETPLTGEHYIDFEKSYEDIKEIFKIDEGDLYLKKYNDHNAAGFVNYEGSYILSFSIYPLMKGNIEKYSRYKYEIWVESKKGNFASYIIDMNNRDIKIRGGGERARWTKGRAENLRENNISLKVFFDYLNTMQRSDVIQEKGVWTNNAKDIIITEKERENILRLEKDINLGRVYVLEDGKINKADSISQFDGRYFRVGLVGEYGSLYVEEKSRIKR